MSRPVGLAGMMGRKRVPPAYMVDPPVLRNAAGGWTVADGLGAAHAGLPELLGTPGSRALDVAGPPLPWSGRLARLSCADSVRDGCGVLGLERSAAATPEVGDA